MANRLLKSNFKPSLEASIYTLKGKKKQNKQSERKCRAECQKRTDVYIYVYIILKKRNGLGNEKKKKNCNEIVRLVAVRSINVMDDFFF